MELWLMLSAGGVLVVGILVYIAFMIFLPEWVGITGKNALDAEKSHSSGEIVPDNDFLSKLQKKDEKH